MINKANEDGVLPLESTPNNVPVKPGYIDVAYMDVQCHLLIRDKDTGEVLVNTRG